MVTTKSQSTNFVCIKIFTMLQKIQCSLHSLLSSIQYIWSMYQHSAASVLSFVVIEKGDHAKLRLALRDRLCGCLITQFCSQPWVFWAEHAHEDETTNKVRVCHSWNFEISLQNSYQRTTVNGYVIKILLGCIFILLS